MKPRSSRWTLVAALALACACGGRGASGAGPNPPEAGDGPAASEEATEDAHRPDGAAPDEAECDALLDHILDIELREHAATVDPEVTPTDDQIADIRADLRAEFLPACLQMPRSAYECAMAAGDREQMAACDNRGT